MFQLFRLLPVFTLGTFILISLNVPVPDQNKFFPESETDSFDIIHYSLNISVPDVNTNFITGISDLQVSSMQDSLLRFTLMLTNLTADSVWIDEVPASQITQRGEYLIIYPPIPVMKGETYVITVFYHGNPIKDDSWGGVFFGDNTAYVMGVAMSEDPPSAGRFWFPCIDDFREKATFEYFITAPPGYTAACPGLLKEVFREDNGYYTFHWSLSEPIPTYLSTFAVSKYRILNDTMTGINNTIPAQYFIPEQKADSVVRSFSNVQKYLNVFESLFGPYAWEKIGFTGVPFTRGAMEHATCISIPNDVIDGTLQSEDLLIHEFAHSWWGNLVTCATAGDMWINEGFASYSVALYKEAVEGRQAYLDYLRRLHRDVLLYNHLREHGYYPVAEVPKELTYSSTVYDKGADMIHNLRSYLGDELFFTSVKSLMKEYRFGNISTMELENFITQTTKKPLKDFFNCWIFTPGFPHFSVRMDHVDTTDQNYRVQLTLSQQRSGRSDYCYNNPIDITLMDSLGQKITVTHTFSGEHQSLKVTTPFYPALAMLDLYEKVNDATVTKAMWIKNAGETRFPECFFTLNVNELTDSIWIRTVFHSVQPDFPGCPDSLDLPFNCYWTVQSILPQGFNAEGRFQVPVVTATTDSIVADSQDNPETFFMLFRPFHSDNWQITNAMIKPVDRFVNVKVPVLKPGDYCIAAEN